MSVIDNNGIWSNQMSDFSKQHKMKTNENGLSQWTLSVSKLVKHSLLCNKWHNTTIQKKQI